MKIRDNNINESGKLKRYNLYFDTKELENLLLKEGIQLTLNDNNYFFKKKALQYYEAGLITPIKGANKGALEVIIGEDYFEYFNNKNNIKDTETVNEGLAYILNNNEKNKKAKFKKQTYKFKVKNIEWRKIEINTHKREYENINIHRKRNEDEEFAEFFYDFILLLGLAFGFAALPYIFSYLSNTNIKVNSIKNNPKTVIYNNYNHNHFYNLKKRSFNRSESLSKKYISGFCDRDGKVLNLRVYNNNNK